MSRIGAHSARALTRIGLATALCAASTAIWASQSQAASGVPAIPHISIGPLQPAPTGLQMPLGPTDTTSGNWSGYAAVNDTYQEVTSTFTQPKVTCPTANAFTVFWVGLDGFSDPTVEQSGTGAYCTSVHGKPTYFTWWEMYPTNSIQEFPLTVKPGNKITATDTYDPNSGEYDLAVFNKTTKQSDAMVTTCASNVTCSNASAEWIVERPGGNGGLYPLADFGKMSLTSDQASDGSGLESISAFPEESIAMVNNSNQVLATVGPLKSGGETFADTWKRVQ